MLKRQTINYDLVLVLKVYMIYMLVESLLYFLYAQDELFLSIVGNADLLFVGFFRYYFINFLFIICFLLGSFAAKFDNLKEPIRYEWMAFFLTAVGAIGFIAESIFDYPPPFGIVTFINLAPLCVYYGIRGNYTNTLFLILVLISICAFFGMRTIFIFSLIFLIYLKKVKIKWIACVFLILLALLIYTQYLRLRITYALDYFDYFSFLLSIKSFIYFYIIKGFYNGVAICSVDPGYSFNSTSQIIPKLFGVASGGADVDLGSHGTMNFVALLWTDFGWMSLFIVSFIGWYLGKATIKPNGRFNEFLIFYTTCGVLLSTRINFFMLNIFIIPFVYLFILRTFNYLLRLAVISPQNHRCEK